MRINKQFTPPPGHDGSVAEPGQVAISPDGTGGHTIPLPHNLPFLSGTIKRHVAGLFNPQGQDPDGDGDGGSGGDVLSALSGGGGDQFSPPPPGSNGEQRRLGLSQGKGERQRPAVPLQDDENRESELTPSDIRGAENYVPSVDDARLVNLVRQRYDESHIAKRYHMGQYTEALAFYGSHQWGYFDYGSGQWTDLRRSKNPNRVYSTRNKIRPKIDKMVARAMAGKVDASVRPLTPSKIDIACAQEGRSVLDHLDRLHDRENQNMRILRMAHIVGPTALKIFFDPDIEVPVPTSWEYLPDGSFRIAEVEDQRQGEIVEKVISPFELYPDPKAERWDDAGWLIHASVVSLEELKRQFPERGFYVRPSGNMTGPSGDVENFLNSLTGDTAKVGTTTGQQTTVLLEMWEKPTIAYPDGRTVWVAEDILLSECAWLYPRLKHFPFAIMEYRPGIETIWGDNAINTATDAQRDLNRAISKQQEKVKEGTGKMMMPRGLRMDKDAGQTGESNERIWYSPLPAAPGLKPEFVPIPPLDPVVNEIIQLADNDIADALDVHEVSEGMTPPSVTAASAIQSLQDQDQTSAVIGHAGYESYHKRRAEIELAIAQECYTGQRLLSVRDTEPKSEDIPNAMKLMRLQAISQIVGQAGGTMEDAGQVVQGMAAGQQQPPAQQGPSDQGAAAAIASPPGMGQLFGKGPTPLPPPVTGYAQSGQFDPPVAATTAGVPAGAPGADQDTQYPNLPTTLPAFTAPGGTGGVLGALSNGGADQGSSSGGSDSDAPKPVSQARAFQALGYGRMVIDATSSSPKSPAARIQQLLDMAQRGMFTPEALPVTIPLLELMEIENNDRLIANLLNVLTMIQARADADKAQAQQTQIQLANIQAQSRPQPQHVDPQAQESAKAQAQIAIQNNKAELEAKLAAIDAQRQLVLKQIDHEHEIEAMTMGHQQKHIGDVNLAHEQARAREEHAPPVVPKAGASTTRSRGRGGKGRSSSSSSSGGQGR